MSSETKQETPDGASELPPGGIMCQPSYGGYWVDGPWRRGESPSTYETPEAAILAGWGYWSRKSGITRTELATMRAAVGRVAELGLRLEAASREIDSAFAREDAALARADRAETERDDAVQAAAIIANMHKPSSPEGETE